MLHHTTLDTATYLLLQNIFTTEVIKNNFALVGGTSLAIQIGHRELQVMYHSLKIGKK